MKLRTVRAVSLPIGVMLIGATVGKYLDTTAGAAIVALGTLLAGRLMPQPRSMRKGPPDAA